MLYMYMLIHTVSAVEFVVVLWNRLYNVCTLYVLKGEDRGLGRGCAYINRIKPPVVNYYMYYWPCRGGTLIFTFILCMSYVYF